MAETFFSMQATNVFGWEFTGQRPSDDFILRMAKIGVVTQYLSDAENDYEGGVLFLTQIGPTGRNKEFTYLVKDGGRPEVVMWTETTSGDGYIIDKWDSDQKISWERVDE